MQPQGVKLQFGYPAEAITIGCPAFLADPASTLWSMYP